ncbi:MAG: hypothetical protein R3282_02085, partial [Rhodothermales bacterium]|nr:hypothetical protein [Rhodothermales bacterium]
GSIFLDSIRLIYHEEEPQEPWLVEEPRPNPLDLPIQVFDDSFINNHGYGLTVDECQSIQITADDSSVGDRSLHVQWDLSARSCPFSGFAASWSAWFPVDIRPILSTAAVQFDLRTASGVHQDLPVAIEIHDYNHSYGLNGSVVSRALSGDYVDGGTYGPEWKTVVIPMSHLEGEADLSIAKELAFRLSGQGDVYIDNIRLVQIG